MSYRIVYLLLSIIHLASNTVTSTCEVPADSTRSFDVRMNNLKLPNISTYYACQQFKIPSDEEYHATVFEPLIENKDLIHHMLLFGCRSQLRVHGAHECGVLDGVCTSWLAQYTIGLDGKICAHNNTGIRFGRNAYSYFLLQIHYNNERLQSGIKGISSETEFVAREPSSLIKMEEELGVVDYIRIYFELRLTYAEIASILELKHNKTISVRHLKRILKSLNLSRRKHYASFDEVVDYIEDQLCWAGSLHGYRWMYEKCTSNGLNVRKEHVRLLLSVIDPIGVQQRRRRRLQRRQYFSRGPNFCWHLDSYDKLKPYGLCINGCIDGFSRKIIWLRVDKTSSDPRVIAKYFVDAVEEHGGCPSFVRGDMGTENCRVADIQRFLRRSGDEEENYAAYIYGKSSMNTRIESWWNILRKQCCQTWIDELRSLKDDSMFSGDELDINLVQFCFTRLLEEELNSVKTIWNSHRIRKSAIYSPGGRPYVLHRLPEFQDVEDYIHEVADDEIQICRTGCAIEDEKPCEEELFEICCNFMVERDLDPPENIIEAKELYIRLRQLIQSEL